MELEKLSPCKVNLLLNILGRRADGFHELETVMQPVKLCDRITFGPANAGVHLTCNDPALPTDSTNLVFRAAAAFLERGGVKQGVQIHLEKRIPMAAGLGGGSGNAATTLLALNELFGQPLAPADLHPLAASLGSDVPFFLQAKPALATGRGERIESFEPFPALQGAALLLIHPGFGIATAWAYKELARFPSARNGQPGRAARLVEALRRGDLARASGELYNSLEAPALEKYPLLGLYQDFLKASGAPATLMSGSGSTTFAVAPTPSEAQRLEALVRDKFGPCWTAVVPLG